MNVSELIQQRRTALGYSQQYVADACGVSRSAVCQWEKGNISNMRRDKVVALARVLQLNPMDIVTGIPEPSELSPATLLQSYLSQLNQDGIDKIVAYAADLVATGRYSKKEERAAK